MKTTSRICLCVSLVSLSSCMSTDVTVPLDRTHPAHPLAEVGESYPAPTVFSLDPLSKLNEEFENPMEGMSHHESSDDEAGSDKMDPMEGMHMNHQMMMERSDDMHPMEGMPHHESSNEARSDKMEPVEGDYQ